MNGLDNLFIIKIAGLLEQPKISNYGKVEMFNAFI